jgi:hypothetical protein
MGRRGTLWVLRKADTPSAKTKFAPVRHRPNNPKLSALVWAGICKSAGLKECTIPTPLFGDGT